MVNLENKVFQENPEIKPIIYCRYVDDCFCIVNSENDIFPLIDAFKKNSVLNFTHELGGKNLNFLDVAIENKDGEYRTQVYQKPTSPGIYLNNSSECPDRYKEGTINSLIQRTYLISSDPTVPTIFQNSLQELKQSLINNG